MDRKGNDFYFGQESPGSSERQVVVDDMRVEQGSAQAMSGEVNHTWKKIKSWLIIPSSSGRCGFDFEISNTTWELNFYVFK